MNISRFIILLVCAVTSLSNVTAQTVVGKSDLNFRFASDVKSLEEFIARFNGDESHPDLQSDSCSRIANICALFDYDALHATFKPEEANLIITDFIEHVISWDKQLSIDDNMVWAQLPCNFTLKSHPFKATLLLQRHTSASGDRKWAIVGVKGLKESHFYNDNNSIISAVDHEIGFMTLDDLFNENTELTPSLRGPDSSIDELSMLIGMALSGNLKLKSTGSVTYHFVSVPGYVFSVREVYNDKYPVSGWLINDLKQAGEFDKLEYINSIFGIK